MRLVQELLRKARQAALRVLPAVILCSPPAAGASDAECAEVLSAAMEAGDKGPQERDLAAVEQKVLRICPDGAAAGYIAAMRLEGAGDLAGAVAAYRKAFLQAVSDAGPGETHYRRAIAFERVGNLAAASGEYQTAISRDPLHGDARRRLAEVYVLRGELEKAIKQYRELVEQRKGNPLLHFKLGKALEKAGRHTESRASYRQAVELDPTNTEVRLELADLARRKNLAAEAEEQYRRILDIDPRHATARSALIRMYISEKKYDDLADLFRDLATREQEDPEMHYRLGLVYEFQKKDEKALESYGTAIRLKPAFAKALTAMGRVYYRRGNFAEAGAALNGARNLDPTLGETQLLLSSLKEETEKRRPKARKADKRKVRKHTLKKQAKRVVTKK